MPPLEKIAVVGLGTMGGEIGTYLANKGSAVYGVDPDPAARARAQESGLFKAIYRDVSEIPKDLDTVIESVTEDPSIKGQVLGQISNRVDDDAYILMVSSTIPSSAYAGVVKNPKRLMNAHILPDLRTRRFVELQGAGPDYSDETTLRDIGEAFKEKRFEYSTVKGESPGFIFNQIWHNVMFTMFKQMDSYDPATIEQSWRDKFGMPYGGVMAMDLIGIDTLYRVFSQVKAKMDIPIPKVIEEMYQAGNLGIKSGRGFFEYPTNDLDGLHQAASDFQSTHKGKEEIADQIWGVIKQGAGKLVSAGQDKEQVFNAIRWGYPIEKEDLLEDLSKLLEIE